MTPERATALARARAADLTTLMGISLEGDAYSRASLSNGGEWAGPCPVCGQGRDSFHIQPQQGRWLCGYCTGREWRDAIDYVRRREGLGFWEAVERLGGEGVTVAAAPRQQHQTDYRPRYCYWQNRPERWLEPALAAADRLAAWQTYKPLSLETIAANRLGVGYQPGVPCRHRRLLVPVFADGKLVNFRGRSFCCNCTGWLTSGEGAVLYGVEEVEAGNTVWWVENNIDALLVSQETEFAGVASTHGAYSWRGLVASLVARQPGLVVVALDNDQAGCPNRETWERLSAEHRERTGGQRLARPNGPQIAAALRAAGVLVEVWRWPAGSRVGADIGEFLIHGMRVAA